jgi:hypothetical protein
MPRYLVEEVREYTERWLIESSSRAEAVERRGTILDHDDGFGSDTGQSLEVQEVADRDEL